MVLPKSHYCQAVTPCLLCSRRISMSYVLSKLSARKILSKYLTLIGVLLVFATRFVGVADACQNECDTADDASCSCVCHSPVATHPDTAVALSTEPVDHYAGDPHSHLLLIVTDIFRPPIA